MLIAQRTVTQTSLRNLTPGSFHFLPHRLERPCSAPLTRFSTLASHSNSSEAHNYVNEPLECQDEIVHREFLQHGSPSLRRLLSSTTVFSLAAAALGAKSDFFVGFDWTDPLSICKALGVLTAVVAVHECGHFLAARLQNIHVSKFAIGFGPSVVRYQGRVVEYSIRALPLGGFVAFPDDDPDCPYSEDDPDLLRNRPLIDRAWVISAGVLANVLFAYTILFTQVSTVGITVEVLEPGIVVPRILKGSAADLAGFQTNDVIVSVDGLVAAPELSSVDRIVQQIEDHPNRPLSFVIDRLGQKLSLQATPVEENGQGRLGIQMATKTKFLNRKARNPLEASLLANREFLRINGEIFKGLQQLIFNFSKSADRVSGPVAMIAMGAEVARMNASQLYLFAAVVNINLAVVNMLPLPALDGGYFALLILEAIRGGKKLPQNIEQGVMTSGILFLMVVGCFLVVRDTVHLASL